MDRSCEGRQLTLRPPLPNPPANAEIENFSEREFLHPKVLQREAAKAFAAAGMCVSGARVRRLVNELVTRRDPVTADAELFRRYVLDHPDPTGEEAVHNILHRPA
ncbi:hypothetical protein [Aeromicrobium sp. 179-A 4D2 NHS]|uniref:hypothetical protein n=1 Tax=Aeromicrobium sp. 179-A 4D2 NHS TaxID=3142375 RepID=UPI0039A11335